MEGSSQGIVVERQDSSQSIVVERQDRLTEIESRLTTALAELQVLKRDHAEANQPRAPAEMAAGDSDHQISVPVEADSELAKVEPAPPSTPDYSSVVNVYSVALAYVVTARDRKAAAKAGVWVVLALLTSAAQIMFSMAMATSLSWGKCFGDSSGCKTGMACISYLNEDGSVLDPACEDCYFLAEQGGAPLDQLYPHRFESSVGSNQSASEFCLDQLAQLHPHLLRTRPEREPSFSSCLYVQASYLTMSSLEYVVCSVAMFVVALSLAQERSEWNQVRWVRRRCLPCAAWPARHDLLAIFEWAAAWMMRFIECAGINMAVTVVPMCMLLLLLFTQGTDSASILLNGLSVVFVLTVDNFVPMGLLSSSELHDVVELLNTAAVRPVPGDAGGELSVQQLLDAHNARNDWNVIASTIFYTILLVRAFNSVGSVKCEQLIHFLYYRISITYCLWGGGLLQLAVNGLIDGLSLMAPSGCPFVPQHRQHSRKWTRLAADELVHVVMGFIDLLVAAFLLNVIYWYCINVLYYKDSKAFDLFSYYVEDLFGRCARGPPWNGACL